MSIAFTYLLANWGLPSTPWLMLWTVLGAITVLLIVLLRTRWSGAPPLRKCAILSLWVHVLLAIVATTVRLVAGAPELGSETPIRVSIRTVVEHHSIEEEIVPDWQQPTEASLVAPESDPLEPPELEPVQPEPQKPAPPLEAPSLLASPISTETAPTQTQQATPPPSPAAAPPKIATPKEPADLPLPTDTPSPAESAPPPTEAEPVPPSIYADRFAEHRDQLAERRGGSEQTERAVRAALGWLASVQANHGGWDASQFGAGQERIVLGHHRRGAGANADTGVTGLALLAFLGSGHTHRQGPYAREVSNGLEYLRQRQRADGALFGDAQLFARMYCHSMATFAVCEAYALTRDSRLEPMARAAVRYALAMQHPTDGGWRYRRGDTGDTSQLGWQLMALKSAQLADIEVPEVTWTRVERFLRRVRRGHAGGLAAYRPGGPASRTMTAEALFCQLLVQAAGKAKLAPASLAEASESITQELPATSRRNLYYWYYATLALHQSQHQSVEASAAWEDWNQALTTTLLSMQQDNGSWSETTVWGGYGGRVYTTALSAMCLEVYYRYSPAEGPSEVAGRKGWHAVR